MDDSGSSYITRSLLFIIIIINISRDNLQQ